jgi:hypothetical protein
MGILGKEGFLGTRPVTYRDFAAWSDEKLRVGDKSGEEHSHFNVRALTAQVGFRRPDVACTRIRVPGCD